MSVFPVFETFQFLILMLYFSKHKIKYSQPEYKRYRLEFMRKLYNCDYQHIKPTINNYVTHVILANNDSFDSGSSLECNSEPNESNCLASSESKLFNDEQATESIKEAHDKNMNKPYSLLQSLSKLYSDSFYKNGSNEETFIINNNNLNLNNKINNSKLNDSSSSRYFYPKCSLLFVN